MFRPSEVQKITNKQLHGGFISFTFNVCCEKNPENSTERTSLFTCHRYQRGMETENVRKTFSLLAFYREGVFILKWEKKCRALMNRTAAVEIFVFNSVFYHH